MRTFGLFSTIHPLESWLVTSIVVFTVIFLIYGTLLPWKKNEPINSINRTNQTKANMSKTTPPLHTLRAILRHLKKQCPSSSTTSTSQASSTTSSSAAVNHSENLKSYLLSQYKQYKHLPPNAPESLHRRKLALNYSYLVSDLTERQTLYELDASAETLLSGQERSRRAAARSGLQLPETYQG